MTHHRLTKEPAASGPRPYVFIDLETTGIEVGIDRIYEIGIVTTSSTGTVMDRYETLIRLDGDVPSRLLSCLDMAPSFVDVAGDVVSRLRAGTVVGHNTSFDLAMLDSEFQRIGAGLPPVHYLDTAQTVMALRLDTPGRRLGPVCRTLGVKITSWHTAAGDAETTSRLFLHLVKIAAQRAVLQRVTQSILFEGSAEDWPAFPTTGRVLVRDPSVLPPLGEQPDEIDPASIRGPSTLLLNLMELIPEEKIRSWNVQLVRASLKKRPLSPDTPPELLQLVAKLDSPDPMIASDAASKISDFQRTPTEVAADQALEDLAADHFPGETGIERLRAIVEVLEDAEYNEEAAEARLRLATALRFSPSHGHEEVSAAYAAAFEAATRIKEDDEEAKEGDEDLVFDDWLGYLLVTRDFEGIVRLVELSADRPKLDPTQIVGFVHSLRTGGEAELAIKTADVFSKALASAGRTAGAADVCAEWAQALAEANNADEALRVCEQALEQGWDSSTLANRESLLLERAKRWPDSLEVCRRGLQLDPSNDQIARRLDRCRAKLKLK
jgi:DNA polymerase III epsilon subunit-like protein/tetratricopeptide (TPR) repeat protein